METKAHIMYVEDDEVLGFVTKDNLIQHNYQVSHFIDGKSALKTFSGSAFDLCIVDVMLPEMDGFELASEIRKKNQEIPILFLTAKSLKEDRIKGLQIGADDYITKPFSIEELILKVEVFLKRKHILQSQQDGIRYIGQYEFDYSALSLMNNGNQKKLTEKEAELLKLLLDNQSKILKRATILERIWGENDYFHGRSMDVFISRLRKYLSEDESIKIENIHGVGFRFHC